MNTALALCGPEDLLLDFGSPCPNFFQVVSQFRSQLRKNFLTFVITFSCYCAFAQFANKFRLSLQHTPTHAYDISGSLHDGEAVRLFKISCMPCTRFTPFPESVPFGRILTDERRLAPA